MKPRDLAAALREATRRRCESALVGLLASVDVVLAEAEHAIDMTKKSSTKTGGGKTALVAPMRAKASAAALGDARFAEVIALIETARSRVFQGVNAELVAHYWQLGEYISRKLATAEWGDGVVDELAADLARRYPGVRG